jgi:hypothetical protein
MMERQLGNRWFVGSYMLEHPESLRYQSVTILRIGQSAGNPAGEALRGHTLPTLTSSRG